MVSQILFLEILLVVLINQPSNRIAVPNLSLCPSPEKHQNCILQCSESNISLPVTFEHPSGEIQGSCPVPGNNLLCVSANYTIYQSLPITYLNISSLDKNRDDGEWRCLHGSSSSETITFYVSSPQRTQEIPQVTITETEIKITCAMLCQYPTTTISVELLYAEEGTSNYTPFPSTPTLTIDSANSSGCDSYERNYKAKFTFTKSDDLSTILGKNITSKCNFTQSIIQTSEDTGPASASFVFQFKGPTTEPPGTTTPPKDHCDCPRLPCLKVNGFCVLWIIVIASCVIIVLIILLFIVCTKCRKKENETKKEVEKEVENNKLGETGTL